MKKPRGTAQTPSMQQFDGKWRSQGQPGYWTERESQQRDM